MRNTPATEGERLSKRVMQLKSCSRREAEQYIEGGHVTVNGVVVETPQARVRDETVRIAADASLLDTGVVSFLLHKPADLNANQAQALLRGEGLLQKHLKKLEAVVPLENGASGLMVFSQDFRVTRKLREDIAVMEHELLIDIAGALEADALAPIQRALQDPKRGLPIAKISLNSSGAEQSRLRLAVKGAHPGLAAYLCELAQLRMVAMKRIRLGRVGLGDLPAGRWRFLDNYERF